MKIENQLEKIAAIQHLELLANQVVEGFISGMHKSPFHGFSAEFAEHKIYNTGESTKHIDWKLFAKTDKLYTKTFEEETNLRCHIIIDNSSSMHYPILQKNQSFYENKIGFSVLATACLMNLLKKQRDAVGCSIYSNTYEFYCSEKGSDRHHRMILKKLEETLLQKQNNKTTDTATFLHQIAKKIHRRSMVILFTDMFQHQKEDAIFKALQHLKHNKHKVVVFHVYDQKTEMTFNFTSSPKKIIDIETGEEVNLFTQNIKKTYEKAIKSYFNDVKNNCLKYKINYVPIAVGKNFEKLLSTYLIEKQRFM